jgi:hypothetical protein
MDHDVKLTAIQTSFQQMVEKGHFSICTAKQAARLLGVSFSGEQETFMELLHCVNFADMPDAVRAELQWVLEEVLSRDAFTITVGKTFFGKPKMRQLSVAAN